MVKKKIAFVLAVFCATVLLMAVQKPVFLAYYAADAAQASVGEWLGVVWHGLTLDSTVAGYVTALPLLLTLVSLWVRLPGRIWRRVLTGYFVLVATVTAVIFAVDVELYQHWGFRLDATILIYLTDPEEAMASVDFWLGVRQTLLAVAYAALMVWVYRLVCRLFDGEPLRRRAALPWSLVLLLLAGCDFLAIRGGLGASVANVSKAYFSANMFLNHAATNPVFSFLTSLGDHTDYAAEYPFFDEAGREERFAPLRGNNLSAAAPERVLTTPRPNVVVVILESFARTVMDADVGGLPVMPNMQRLKGEGIWFENFFANSFRTDRGEVAILSGFPAQTRMSIMKLPAKSRNLPSLARSLSCSFKRIQFTPDITPSDITGFTMPSLSGDMQYRPGAIMSQIVLADEINRTSPKTQSALLEVMEERQVTVDGVTYPLARPFMVLATQNPVDFVGTYPLPEAQMDRFLMKLSMEALSPAEEIQMIARFLTEEPLAELSSVCQKEEIRALQEACKEVYLHPELVQYLVRIVQETRVNSKIASGVSPRGTLAFLRAVQGHALVQGRNYVVPEDFKTVAVPVLAHRLTMQIGADDGRAAESVIEEILNRIDLPTENWSGR